jgi:hypothetical protein
VWLATSVAFAGADGSDYTLSIDSQLQIRTPGQAKPQEMTAVTGLDYRLVEKAGTVEVSIVGLHTVVSSEGKTVADRRMSRTGARFAQGTQAATEITFDKAPAALQEVLRDFETPLARLTLDAAGVESKREILVNPASTLVENGMIENARLFHAPYRDDVEEWTAPAKLPVGHGQYATGTLTYRKTGTDAQGKSSVQVLGELSAQGKLGPADIKKGTYSVNGTQVFDTGAKAWVSGQLNIEVSLDLLVAGNSAGTSTGVMKLGLQKK